MAYFCYVARSAEATPYMEAIDEVSLEAAAMRARRLLDERPRCDRAEIYEGDRKCVTITRD